MNSTIETYIRLFVQFQQGKTVTSDTLKDETVEAILVDRGLTHLVIKNAFVRASGVTPLSSQVFVKGDVYKHVKGNPFGKKLDSQAVSIAPHQQIYVLEEDVVEPADLVPNVFLENQLLTLRREQEPLSKLHNNLFATQRRCGRDILTEVHIPKKYCDRPLDGFFESTDDGTREGCTVNLKKIITLAESWDVRSSWSYQHPFKISSKLKLKCAHAYENDYNVKLLYPKGKRVMPLNQQDVDRLYYMIDTFRGER